MTGKPVKMPKVSPWGDDNPEKLTKTVGWSEQLKGLFSPDSLVGQITGETHSGELINSRIKERKSQRPKNEITVFSYSRSKEEQKIYQETTVILQKLQQQVTMLEKSNKGLVTELSKVKLDRVPPKTGIYYIRFLEWLLTVVSQMRVKVEEGRAWLSTFSKRKQKKMGYWKMYKKHGTTFGLSQERSLATQTG